MSDPAVQEGGSDPPWRPMNDENSNVGTGNDPVENSVNSPAGHADTLGGADDLEHPAEDLSAWGPGGVPLGVPAAGGSEPGA